MATANAHILFGCLLLNFHQLCRFNFRLVKHGEQQKPAEPRDFKTLESFTTSKVAAKQETITGNRNTYQQKHTENLQTTIENTRKVHDMLEPLAKGNPNTNQVLDILRSIKREERFSKTDRPRVGWKCERRSFQTGWDLQQGHCKQSVFVW